MLLTQLVPDYLKLTLYEQQEKDARHASFKRRESLQVDSTEAKLDVLRDDIEKMRQTIRTNFEIVNGRLDAMLPKASKATAPMSAAPIRGSQPRSHAANDVTLVDAE